MQQIISHRGNINGRNSKHENNPTWILEMLKKYPKLYVEIDMWVINGVPYLGHDEPIYKLDYKFKTYLVQEDYKFYINCKNYEAIEFCNRFGFKHFTNNYDPYAMIKNSNKILTCEIQPFEYVKHNPLFILLSSELYGFPFKKLDDEQSKHFFGVITDYPLKYLEGSEDEK